MAGDHKTADKLKSRTTSDTFQIERKGAAISQIPNRLHILMTTNHDHAVPAGVGARRFVVYDVSDEHACDETWFDPLYRDMNDGGAEEFLYLLQNLKLGDWHPRQILKTSETIEQQRMSGDSVTQWAQACIDADFIVGAEWKFKVKAFSLGQAIPSKTIRTAYTGFCREHRISAMNKTNFGKACADVRTRKHLAGERFSPAHKPPSSMKWRKSIKTRPQSWTRAKPIVPGAMRCRTATHGKRRWTSSLE